jgi:hypothetical protein
VARGNAEVVVVAGGAVEAPPVEVDDEPLDEEPQPATTIQDASTTTKTESLFMASRLAI